MDADTTEVCLAAHGTVLPADDSWWDEHAPPLHFNCRSTVETLSPEEAEEHGITENPTELKAQEGFGHRSIGDETAALDKWAEKKLEVAGPLLAQSFKDKKEAWEQEEAKRKAEQGQQATESTATQAPGLGGPPEAQSKRAEKRPARGSENSSNKDPEPSRGNVASQLSGDAQAVEIGQLPLDVLGSIRPATGAVQLSIQTLTKNRNHHPDVPEAAYDEIERIMQAADLVVEESDGSIAFLRLEDQMYLVVRPTAARKATFVRSLRRASKKEAARMLRRGTSLRNK